MEELYRDARRAIVESRAQLESLERDGRSEVSAVLRGNLEALDVTTQQLTSLFNREQPQKRELWRQRLLQLDEELSELRRGQERWASRARVAKDDQRMREELLSRRRMRGEGNGDATIHIDGFEAEAKSLKSSTNMSDQILETGTATLEMLYAQRAKLKGARKRLLDVANQLGVSKDLIRSIEKREMANTYIVLGGIGLCIVFILVVWLWRRT